MHTMKPEDLMKKIKERQAAAAAAAAAAEATRAAGCIDTVASPLGGLKPPTSGSGSQNVSQPIPHSQQRNASQEVSKADPRVPTPSSNISDSQSQSAILPPSKPTSGGMLLNPPPALVSSSRYAPQFRDHPKDPLSKTFTVHDAFEVLQALLADSSVALPGKKRLRADAEEDSPSYHHPNMRNEAQRPKVSPPLSPNPRVGHAALSVESLHPPIPLSTAGTSPGRVSPATGASVSGLPSPAWAPQKPSVVFATEVLQRHLSVEVGASSSIATRKSESPSPPLNNTNSSRSAMKSLSYLLKPSAASVEDPLLEDEWYKEALRHAHVTLPSGKSNWTRDAAVMTPSGSVRFYQRRSQGQERSGVYGVVYGATIDEAYLQEGLMGVREKKNTNGEPTSSKAGENPKSAIEKEKPKDVPSSTTATKTTTETTTENEPVASPPPDDAKKSSSRSAVSSDSINSIHTVEADKGRAGGEDVKQERDKVGEKRSAATPATVRERSVHGFTKSDREFLQTLWQWREDLLTKTEALRQSIRLGEEDKRSSKSSGSPHSPFSKLAALAQEVPKGLELQPFHDEEGQVVAPLRRPQPPSFAAHPRTKHHPSQQYLSHRGGGGPAAQPPQPHPPQGNASSVNQRSVLSTSHPITLGHHQLSAVRRQLLFEEAQKQILFSLRQAEMEYQRRLTATAAASDAPVAAAPVAAATAPLFCPTVFALKAFKPEPVREYPYGLRGYFLREVDIALRLRHPNIVRGIEVVLNTPVQPRSLKRRRWEEELDRARREMEVELRGEWQHCPTAQAPAITSSSTSSILSLEARVVRPSADKKENNLPAEINAEPKKEETEAKTHEGAEETEGRASTSTTSHNTMYLVMEYCSFNLKDYMSLTPFFYYQSRNKDPRARVEYLSRAKNILYQVLQGLAFLHENRILHRDLKPSNILLNRDAEVKLCDFGLSTFYSETCPKSLRVVTLFYRAPEILFGYVLYGAAVDIWSVGCIFAEMFLQQPLFLSNEEIQEHQEKLQQCGALPAPHPHERPNKYSNEEDTGAMDSHQEEERRHLLNISNVLGIPNDKTFPGVYNDKVIRQKFQDLPSWNEENRLQEIFTKSERPSATLLLPEFVQSLHATTETASEEKRSHTTAGLDLLQRMLTWNPRDRISAADALRHPFFTEELPRPSPRSHLVVPLPGFQHR